MSDQPITLSIMVEQRADGRNEMFVALDDLRLLTMGGDRVLSYVAAWTKALAQAEHDAAVIAQLALGAKIGMEAALATTTSLRLARPLLDLAATAPLRLEPMVARRDARGYVAAYLGDKRVMQLDATRVNDHITKVLATVWMCELDDAYRDYAMNYIGHAAGMADVLIRNLHTWREHDGTRARAIRRELERATRDMRKGEAGGPGRSGNGGPGDLPEPVQDALLAYAAAATAAADGRGTPAAAATARQALAECCTAAGLDPAQVIPPPGVSLNPGGRWIPPKRRHRNRGGGTP